MVCTVLLACCCSCYPAGAQPSLKSLLDRTEILIGDQFNLRLEARFSPEEYRIRWPVIPDSLAHFEVVGRSKMDSVFDNHRLTGLTQTLTLTSFDSGTWVLPPFLLSLIPEKADTSYTLFTDSVPIRVSFSASDTSSQIRDIKPIRQVESFSSTWYWVAGLLIAAALVVLFIWWSRRRKKTPAGLPLLSKLSAYEEAIMELQTLETYDLAAPGSSRNVHQKLGDIVKRYLTRSQHSNFLNKTTGDLLILFRDQSMDADLLSKAAGNLRLADAVKFARYLPSVDETALAINETRQLIESFHARTKNSGPAAKS